MHLLEILNRLIYLYWAWKLNFFIIKIFFLKYFKPIKPTKPTTKNRTAIGRKTDLRQYASVLIMKKPISIGSVINLEKNCHYRIAHTPSVSNIGGWSFPYFLIAFFFWGYLPKSSQLTFLFWGVLIGLTSIPFPKVSKETF